MGLLYLLSEGLLAQKLFVKVLKEYSLSLRFAQGNTRYSLQHLHLRAHKFHDEISSRTLRYRVGGERN